MTHRIFMPLYKEEVAPRFDLAAEVLMADCETEGRILNEKVLILPGSSAEQLCHIVMTEHIETVICGGIDQEVYDYLVWKQVKVIDDVIGSRVSVLRRYALGRLKSGDLLLS